MIRTHHGRARVRRAAARPQIVEHRVAKQMDVLPLDLDGHRTGGDELGRSVKLAEIKPPPVPLLAISPMLSNVEPLIATVLPSILTVVE